MKTGNKVSAAKGTHTPGPWIAFECGEGFDHGAVLDSNDSDPQVICWTEVDDIMVVQDQSEREANARLIAAAPALAAALREAASALESASAALDYKEDHENGRKVWAQAEQARAALAMVRP